MFIEKIATLWAQLVTKLAAPWSLTARVGPKRGGLTLDEPSLDEEARTEPFVPANSERLSESSLHLSC